MKTCTLIAALAAALVFSFPTQAREIATLNNTAGGKIVFTDEYCNSDGETYVVYSFNQRGNALFGCWVPVSKKRIAVQWGNGKASIFPTDQLEPVGSDNKNKGE